MRVLVTGGLGYAGKPLTCCLLHHGHDVTALSRSARGEVQGIDVVVADLRDKGRITKLMADQRYDAVVHLAARTHIQTSVDDPIGYFETNLCGTINLLAAMDELTVETGRPGRLVFASTSAVYGPLEGCLSEDDPTGPTNPYGASKSAAEQAVIYAARTGRLSASILRCFNIAGGEDVDTSRLISKALAVAAGRYRFVQVNGDGSVSREYTHVRDVAEAFRLTLESVTDGLRIYNVGSSNAVSILEVLETARRITGRQIPVEYLPRRDEPRVVTADTTRIRSELGWVPLHSDLDEIIVDTWSCTQRVMRNPL